MPLFDYECTSCSYKFEKLVMGSEFIEFCPKCACRVKKLPSLSTFKLNGYTEANGYTKETTVDDYAPR
jgi:putative FmdB family regulatory protein